MAKRPNDDLEEGELDEIECPAIETCRDTNEDLMQYAILPMTKIQGDTPMTGEEYLYMVREERNRLPKVATADIRDTTRKTIGELVPVSETVDTASVPFKAEEQWQQQVLEVFKSDRNIWSTQLYDGSLESTAELPAINDEIAWKKYLYSCDVEVEPSFEIFCALGHVAKMRLLLYHHRWLENADQMATAQYKWIYCLLVNTPEGLSADDMSIIRALTRSCIKLRSSSAADWDAIANLNAIIAIVGLYFRQTDLLQ